MSNYILLVFVSLCGLVALSAASPVREWFPLQFSSKTSKIIDGVNAEEGKYPYMVSLRYGKQHFCGGSILNGNWVITAAHCVKRVDPSRIHVVTGSLLLSTGGDKYQVSKIIIHENHNSISALNDVALLNLESPIYFSDKVQPIPVETEEVGAKVKTVLSGWGDMWGAQKPDHLQTVFLETISLSECQAAYQKPIKETQICTSTHQGFGGCHGDSGGPLASEGKLIGIVSWGTPCARGKPDVYTKVSAYVDWISKIIEES